MRPLAIEQQRRRASGLAAGRWLDGSALLVFSSVEVAGATDVRVHDRRSVRGGGRLSAIGVGLQDRGNRSIGARADLECAAAGGFQSLIPEAVGVPEDADRGAEALLWLRRLAQDA